MPDPFDLERFVSAQALVYDAVVRELGDGLKQTHWMWFIFPQVDGLGSSPTARRYAIRSLPEATAYLAHPVLGPRLIECTQLVNNTDGKSVHDIFGFPDDMKFHSSVTLFSMLEPGHVAFGKALDKYFGGVPDAPMVAIAGRRAVD